MVLRYSARLNVHPMYTHVKVEDRHPSLPGESLPLVPHAGLSQVEVEGAHGSALAFLDTGAHLSYAPATAVCGLVPVEQLLCFARRKYTQRITTVPFIERGKVVTRDWSETYGASKAAPI